MNDDRQHDEEHDAQGEEAPRGRIEYRRPGPHGAAAIPGEVDAEDVLPAVEAEIQRAYRRAERSTKRVFQEVTPRTVVAAEACTSYSDEEDDPSKSKLAPHSRACFLATAAYGDTHAPDVERLRNWRDRRLIGNPVGALLVRAYYRMSPPVARFVARSPRLRTVLRAVIAWTLRSGRRGGPALAS